jgi:hypothetical protein
MGKGIEYIGDKDLLQTFFAAKSIYRGAEDTAEKDPSFVGLDTEYDRIKEQSFMNTIRFIRNNPDEYFVFVNN